jgi:hypothetical protein
MVVALAAVSTAVSPVLAAKPKIEAPGEVSVMSLTNGATIEIDGKVVGTVPFDESLLLLPGQHTIKVTKRGFATYDETFEVKAGESVELEIDLLPFAGMVKITTAEPGATVKVDGKVEGTTPFDKDIPAGKKVFTVSRPEFYDEVRELDVRAGEFYQLDIQLRPMPKKEPEVAGEAFYETWWFWTIVGVAGAGAAAAVVATSTGGETVSPRPNFSLNVP